MTRPRPAAFLFAFVTLVLLFCWVALAGVALAASPEADVEKPAKFLLRPVGYITQHLYDGDLAEPRGVFVDRTRGEVWVADTRNGLLGVFTPDGVPLFATEGGGKISEPARVAASPDGRLYVLDNDRSKVKVLSYRGEFLGALELPGVGKSPSFGAITVDDDGNLWVGENTECQVLSFGRDLKPRGRFGSCGSGEGEFQSIAGIAVTRTHVVVTDHQVLAVQVFDRRGTFLKGWGKHDMGIQNFSLPEGVAVDAKGRIVVVDALRHEIKYFDFEGNFLDRFGGLGSRAGQIAFPADVALGADGRLYVAEKGNGRVQVFVEEAAATAAAAPPPPRPNRQP